MACFRTTMFSSSSPPDPEIALPLKYRRKSNSASDDESFYYNDYRYGSPSSFAPSSSPTTLNTPFTSSSPDNFAYARSSPHLAFNMDLHHRDDDATDLWHSPSKGRSQPVNARMRYTSVAQSSVFMSDDEDFPLTSEFDASEFSEDIDMRGYTSDAEPSPPRFPEDHEDLGVSIFDESPRETFFAISAERGLWRRSNPIPFSGHARDTTLKSAQRKSVGAALSDLCPNPTLQGCPEPSQRTRSSDQSYDRPTSPLPPSSSPLSAMSISRLCDGDSHVEILRSEDKSATADNPIADLKTIAEPSSPIDVTSEADRNISEIPLPLSPPCTSMSTQDPPRQAASPTPEKLVPSRIPTPEPPQRSAKAIPSEPATIQPLSANRANQPHPGQSGLSLTINTSIDIENVPAPITRPTPLVSREATPGNAFLSGPGVPASAPETAEPIASDVGGGAADDAQAAVRMKEQFEEEKGMAAWEAMGEGLAESSIAPDTTPSNLPDHEMTHALEAENVERGAPNAGPSQISHGDGKVERKWTVKVKEKRKKRLEVRAEGAPTKKRARTDSVGSSIPTGESEETQTSTSAHASARTSRKDKPAKDDAPKTKPQARRSKPSDKSAMESDVPALQAEPFASTSTSSPTTPPSDSASTHPETPELLGLLIETFATSRASSLPASSLYKSLIQSRPALKAVRSRDKWLRVISGVLEDGRARSGVFDKVESKGTDGDNKLEAQWFYVPEQDEDQERAALIRSIMPRAGKRSETKKSKQYYWRPLDKISRWDPEDDL
ncbi:hypothetical protein PLICRDRAFT_474294 [Plicaturopsis crispa FD-325 SS-3]|nr:hypothetical protein PLICRDRAFT_474294 [Plicaturopsis crispa FD-325 SS-3]